MADKQNHRTSSENTGILFKYALLYLWRAQNGPQRRKEEVHWREPEGKASSLYM